MGARACQTIDSLPEVRNEAIDLGKEKSAHQAHILMHIDRAKGEAQVYIPACGGTSEGHLLTIKKNPVERDEAGNAPTNREYYGAGAQVKIDNGQFEQLPLFQGQQKFNQAVTNFLDKNVGTVAAHMRPALASPVNQIYSGKGSLDIVDYPDSSFQTKEPHASAGPAEVNLAQASIGRRAAS